MRAYAIGMVDPGNEDGMTTVETQTFTLPVACETAGNGGLIQGPAGGREYLVGQDENGSWTLSFDGCEPHSLVGYVEEGWTIRSGGVEEEVATQTFQEFFDSLTLFSFVKATYGEYIFLGWAPPEDDDLTGTARAKVLHSRYMEVTYYGGSDLTAQCDWVRQLDSSGDPLIADATLRSALRHLETHREDLAIVGKRVRQLETSYQGAVSDFRTLNDHLNEYADENSMCSDYEARLWSWNEDFSDLRLFGRMKSYQVPVNIPALSSEALWVYPVEARSPEEARREIESWSRDDILKSIIEHGPRLNNIEIDFDAGEAQAS